MAKGFVKNTVPGKQRGKAYNEKFRTMCLVEMLTDDIHVVAKRHGVPESTLRTWQKKESGREDEWAAARADAIKSVSALAAAGTQAAVQQVLQALEDNEISRERRLELIGMVLSGQADDDQKEAAREALELLKPMSDQALAGYLRALTHVAERAGVMLGEGASPEVRVIISEEAKEYGG